MHRAHAVIRIDHAQADVLDFVSEPPHGRHLKAHRHPTRQHASGVRTEHEFFAEVCDAVEGVAEVLVVGARHALADFSHYVRKHRPETAGRIVGYDVVAQPTEAQLAALARQFFDHRDHLADIGALPGQ